MTPDTEKRIAEIRERMPYGGAAATRWGGMYADDCAFLLSIIDELRAENEARKNKKIYWPTV